MDGHQTTPELVKLEDEYEKAFGDGYPATFLHHMRDPDYHIMRIKECLEKGEPIPPSEYAPYYEELKKKGLF